MAIERVNIPTPTAPVGVADYQAQLDQITELNQAFTGRLLVDSSTIRAGTVMMIGSVLYKAITDTAITGTPSNYVKVTPSLDGLTATASFVASLTGVTWNNAYGGYYDGGLPDSLYVFDESIAVRSGAIASPKTIVGKEGYSWDQALDSEISTRASADSALSLADGVLQNNIDQEALDRTSADSAEASARASADSALQTLIDNIKTADAVGSFAFMKQVSGTAKVVGDSIVGSSLQYSDVVGNSTSPATGTWRCMGNSPNPGTSVTLWVRIS